MDLLAWNPGGLALYTGLDDWPARQRNLARYLFLHPAARGLFTDWDRQITACVARLRAVAGTAPDLTNLVGELLLKSPDFAGLWERYEVTGRRPAHKTFHHPQVGTVTLTSQSLHVEGTPGQRIGLYIAEPGTPDHDALLLLDMTAPRPPQRSAHTPRATGQQPQTAVPVPDLAPRGAQGRAGRSLARSRPASTHEPSASSPDVPACAAGRAGPTHSAREVTLLRRQSHCGHERFRGMLGGLR